MGPLEREIDRVLKFHASASRDVQRTYRGEEVDLKERTREHKMLSTLQFLMAVTEGLEEAVRTLARALDKRIEP